MNWTTYEIMVIGFGIMVQILMIKFGLTEICRELKRFNDREEKNNG